MIGLGKEVIVEHATLNAVNTYLEQNADSYCRLVTVYVTGLGVTTYVTSHYE